VALPAFAAARCAVAWLLLSDGQQSIDISCSPGPQQQTRNNGCGGRINQSINQSVMLFRVVQVTKSLQDPLEVGNSLLGISDNVRE